MLCLFGAFLGQQLFAMQYAKVIGGPLAGKTAQIVGSLEELYGINDIWMSPKSFSIPAIKSYLIANPPSHGKVYYGKVEGLGYCFHESWLQEEETSKAEVEEAEDFVSAQIGNTKVGGPKWFVDAMRRANSESSSAR